MRSGNGVKVYMLPPLTDGTPAAGVDPLTWQKLKADCPDNEVPGVDGYGRPLAGGYGRPMITWVEFYDALQLEKKDDEAMGVSVDSATSRGRFLAFPRPQRGYLIINPTTDDRFVVEGVVQAYMFAGKTPVAYDLSLQLLDRNDARYRLQVNA